MQANSVFKSPKAKEAIISFYEGILAKWPYRFDTRLVDTGYGQTHIITAGDEKNPPLVLLHGSASNSLSWGGDIPEYAKYFHVMAPDIPGEAGKSDERRLSWSNNEYVDWLDGLFQSLSIGNVNFVGISLGGWMATKYAAYRPDNVNRLVLLAPGGIAPAKTSAILKTIWYSKLGEKGSDKMKKLVFGTDEIQSDVGRFFDLVQAHFMPRFGSPPLLTDEELGGITAPLLMIAGEKDAFFPSHKAKRRIENTVKNQMVTIIPSTGHGLVAMTDEVIPFLLK